MRSLLVVFVALSCAPADDLRPDGMSADAHRRAAARDEEAAQRELDAYQPNAIVGVDTSVPLSFPPDIYNPTSFHIAEAARHAAHARAHEAAAVELERFEQAECADFPAKTRAACPLLGPIVLRRNVEGGVLFELGPSVDTVALVAHMRCHLAYARANGYPQLDGCPLYLKGVRVDRAGPHSVVILSDDSFVADQIRADATEIAP